MEYKDKMSGWAVLKDISEELIVDFLHGNVSEEVKTRISKQIESDITLKEWFQERKREFDIERYVNGELTSEEESALMKLIKRDKKMQELLNLHKDVQLFLKEMTLEEGLKKELSKLDISPCLKNSILLQLKKGKC